MNDLQQLEDRLQALEERLERLEDLLERQPAAQEFIFEELPPAPQAVPPRRWLAPAPRPFPVTELLGWGGVAALVLAAAYLVKLGIDLGWLTPARQVLLAVLVGGPTPAAAFRKLTSAHRGPAQRHAGAQLVKKSGGQTHVPSILTARDGVESRQSA